MRGKADFWLCVKGIIVRRWVCMFVDSSEDGRVPK